MVHLWEIVAKAPVGKPKQTRREPRQDDDANECLIAQTAPSAICVPKAGETVGAMKANMQEVAKSDTKWTVKMMLLVVVMVVSAVSSFSDGVSLQLSDYTQVLLGHPPTDFVLVSITVITYAFGGLLSTLVSGPWYDKSGPGVTLAGFLAINALGGIFMAVGSAPTDGVGGASLLAIGRFLNGWSFGLSTPMSVIITAISPPEELTLWYAVRTVSGSVGYIVGFVLHQQAMLRLPYDNPGAWSFTSRYTLPGLVLAFANVGALIMVVLTLTPRRCASIKMQFQRRNSLPGIPPCATTTTTTPLSTTSSGAKVNGDCKETSTEEKFSQAKHADATNLHVGEDHALRHGWSLGMILLTVVNFLLGCVGAVFNTFAVTEQCYVTTDRVPFTSAVAGVGVALLLLLVSTQLPCCRRRKAQRDALVVVSPRSDAHGKLSDTWLTAVALAGLLVGATMVNIALYSWQSTIAVDPSVTTMTCYATSSYALFWIYIVGVVLCLSWGQPVGITMLVSLFSRDVQQHTPPRKAATNLAIFTAARLVGSVLMPFAVAAVDDLYGPVSVWFFPSTITIGLLALYTVVVAVE